MQSPQDVFHVRIMEVTLYSADEKSVFVDFKAISCREESCGSDTEKQMGFDLMDTFGVGQSYL